MAAPIEGMQGKNSWAEAHWDAGLKRHLSEADLRGIQAGAAIAQRWANVGALAGLTTGCIVGFPYPRKFSSTLLATLRALRTGQAVAPPETSPFVFALARAHRAGLEQMSGTPAGAGRPNMSMRQAGSRALLHSLTGAAWALFFSFAGRTGGALASTWPAEQAIRREGGDPERIKRAASQIYYELEDARKRAGPGGQLEPPSGDDGVGLSGDVLRDDAGTGAAPPAGSGYGERFKQAVVLTNSSASASDAAPPSTSSAGENKSRWDELRADRTATPSAWERIRQDQARPSAQPSPAADAAATQTAAATDEPQPMPSREEDRERRQREFQQLIDREARGGGDGGDATARSSRSV